MTFCPYTEHRKAVSFCYDTGCINVEIIHNMSLIVIISNFTVFVNAFLSHDILANRLRINQTLADLRYRSIRYY